MAAVTSWCQNVIKLMVASLVGLGVVTGVCAQTPSGQVEPVIDEVTKVAPDPASQALHTRLQSLERYQANFSQVIEGGRGQIVERSNGRVVMARPNFHWMVAQPYPQHIVSADNRLSVFDPDLAQVIVKPLSEALQDTPVALLTTEGIALGGNFDVIMLSGDGAEPEDVFVLSPRLADSLFSEIRLHFTGLDLTQLGILDHLGQYTQIRFSEVQRPAVVDSSEFVLDLPPDIDVIEG